MIEKQNKSTRTLYLSLPDKTYYLIKIKALKEHMSVAAWIRHALGDKPRRRYRVGVHKQARAQNAE